MATGAEHYLEAERLLEATRGELVKAAKADLEAGLVDGHLVRDALVYTAPDLARAQVHATLALAAATAYAAEGTGVLIRGYGDRDTPQDDESNDGVPTAYDLLRAYEAEQDVAPNAGSAD